MRWKTKYTRHVKRFALFPIKAHCCDKPLASEYRWLETTYLFQRRDWLFGMIPIWHTEMFIDKDIYETRKKSQR